uniref:Uncharacterized protein n=1 Tax=Sphaerodactylus townsendi TaxID=933632 RepID=A0ACB8FQ61_9SAUR
MSDECLMNVQSPVCPTLQLAIATCGAPALQPGKSLPCPPSCTRPKRDSNTLTLRPKAMPGRRGPATPSTAPSQPTPSHPNSPTTSHPLPPFPTPSHPPPP